MKVPVGLVFNSLDYAWMTMTCITDADTPYKVHIGFTGWLIQVNTFCPGDLDAQGVGRGLGHVSEEHLPKVHAPAVVGIKTH
jgi:hypothetical protein